MVAVIINATDDSAVSEDVVDEARLGSMARGGVGSLGSMFYHKLQF